jgi:hypothetical protein
MEDLLAIHTDGNPPDCGRGLKLPKGTPVRNCTKHGYKCWKRFSPVEVAMAVMTVAAAELGEPAPDVTNIPPELVEEIRKKLLAHGLEEEL